MTDEDRVVGLAALGLLETLLVVVTEKKLLTREEVDEIFLDTAEAFDAAGRDEGNPDHRAVARLLERIQAGNDTIRRP